MAEVIPVIVTGAAGRMGRTILNCLPSADRHFQLLAALESPSHASIGVELTTLIPSAPLGFTITSEPPPDAVPGTVLIDFSVPECTLAIVDWIERTGHGAVIGTTGFSDDERARIEEAALKAPIVLAPNMSVGVNVLFDLAERAVRLLGEGYDVEITEMHHRFKIDAPSGTANRLAEVIRQARGDEKADLRFGRRGLPGQRTPKEIGMHVLRGGDVVGDHTVIFATLGERLEITHRAGTRETFARGALRAAAWLSGRDPGFYSIKDVLGL